MLALLAVEVLRCEPHMSWSSWKTSAASSRAGSLARELLRARWDTALVRVAAVCRVLAPATAV